MKIAVTSARVACAPAYLIFRIKGDINKDGEIDISDVISCLRMAVGLDPVDLSLADMNDSGTIDITDVIKVLRKAIGLDQ